MMDMPRNQFLAKLGSGETLFGLWLGIPDNTVAEMMAGAGFDWLVIDHEHGPYELRDIMSHLQAIAPYDVAPIVRPVDDSPALLKKLCDIGVQTFLIPMVESADQAAAAVSAVRYPPAGRRGLGASMSRAARWDSVVDYLHKAGNEMCVIAQAETLTALENLESIANTDGINGIFFGPSDLSASMGHLGDPAHPEVVDAISSGIRTVAAAGKYTGLLSLDRSQVRHYVDCGADFVGVGVDTLLLGKAARALAASHKHANQNDDSQDH